MADEELGGAFESALSSYRTFVREGTGRKRQDPEGIEREEEEVERTAGKARKAKSAARGQGKKAKELQESGRQQEDRERNVTPQDMPVAAVQALTVVGTVVGVGPDGAPPELTPEMRAVAERFYWLGVSHGRAGWFT